MKVLRYRGDLGLSAGQVVEIRGIVNRDCTISFGEHNLYENNFDIGAHRSMLEYFHGFCKDLCYK